MATPQWARVANTTTQEYMKGEEVEVIRNRKLLAMMESRGRITFNHSGQFADWKIRFKRAPVQGYADSDTITFSKQNRWKTAQNDWRGYTVQDQMTILEELQNKGDAAIVKYVGELVGLLIEDITEGFGDEMYVDGNAAGNSKRIHGLESFLGNSGAAAAGYIASPSDTYAGLSTALGNYGGSWSTSGGNVNWPSGTGDYHYDFFSPVVVDYTDTAWSAGTKTWPNTCREAMRFGIIKSRRNKSKSGMLNMIMLENELYRQFEEKAESSERIVFQKGGSAKGLISLGFDEGISFEGAEVTYEYGVPTAVGYGVSIDNMELCSLQDRLFVVHGPDDDISGLAKRIVITFFGNLKFRPRYFCKFAAVT